LPNMPTDSREVLNLANKKGGPKPPSRCCDTPVLHGGLRAVARESFVVSFFELVGHVLDLPDQEEQPADIAVLAICESRRP
jgi:hypothetical protein